MADFDTTACEEAERRYPDKGGCYEEHARHAYARAAFEAGARWGASPLNMTTLRATFARAERAEAALAEVAALADEWAKHAHEWPNMLRASSDLRAILARAQQTGADR